ncbi:MAG TPA: hydrolase, partial [Acidimicrobiaceae bacterium]|nr:hydrolase [Acidimicrobiaceae bacterium]
MALSSFADGSLFGTRLGTESPRVVALHGWGRSHQDFASSLEGLDAISIDLPGFGVSPAPLEVGGASMYANLVSPILDICDTPVVLVGHS